MTTQSAFSISYNFIAGTIAYIAGSYLCIYNPSTNETTNISNKSSKQFTCVKFSPMNNYLAAGEICFSKVTPSIYIWAGSLGNIQFNEISKELKGHKSGILAIEFSQDEKYLLSIGNENDMGIFLWELETKQRIGAKKLKNVVLGLCFDIKSNSFITVGDNFSKFWQYSEEEKNIKSKKLEISIKASQKYVSVSSFQNTIFVLTEEGILYFIEQDKKTVHMNLQTKTAFFISVNDGQLICGCANGIIRLFSINPVKHIITLPNPPSYNASNPNNEFPGCIFAIKDSNLERNRIVSLYSDRTLIVWDLKKQNAPKKKRILYHHSGPIHGIAFDENPNIFYSGSEDGTIRGWQLHKETISKDPSFIKASSNNQIKIIKFPINKTSNQNIESEVSVDKENVFSCLISEGKYIIAGDSAVNLKVFNSDDLSLKNNIPAHNQEVVCLDSIYNPETKISLLASGSRDRLIHIFNITNNFERVASCSDHTSTITSLKFALPIAKEEKKEIKLISSSADKSIIFRIISDNFEIKRFHIELDKTNKIYSFDYNPLSDLIAVGQENKISFFQSNGTTIKSFGNQIDSKKSHSFDNIFILIDPVSKYLFTSTSDKVIKIRDLEDGKSIFRLENTGITTSIKISRDFSRIITASSEGFIFIYRLPEAYTNFLKNNLNNGPINLQKKDVVQDLPNLSFDILNSLSSPEKQKIRLEKINRIKQEAQESSQQIDSNVDKALNLINNLYESRNTDIVKNDESKEFSNKFLLSESKSEIDTEKLTMKDQKEESEKNFEVSDITSLSNQDSMSVSDYPQNSPQLQNLLKNLNLNSQQNIKSEPREMNEIKIEKPTDKLSLGEISIQIKNDTTNVLCQKKPQIEMKNDAKIMIESPDNKKISAQNASPILPQDSLDIIFEDKGSNKNKTNTVEDTSSEEQVIKPSKFEEKINSEDKINIIVQDSLELIQDQKDVKKTEIISEKVEALDIKKSIQEAELNKKYEKVQENQYEADFEIEDLTSEIKKEESKTDEEILDETEISNINKNEVIDDQKEDPNLNFCKNHYENIENSYSPKINIRNSCSSLYLENKKKEESKENLIDQNELKVQSKAPSNPFIESHQLQNVVAKRQLIKQEKNKNQDLFKIEQFFQKNFDKENIQRNGSDRKLVVSEETQTGEGVNEIEEIIFQLNDGLNKLRSISSKVKSDNSEKLKQVYQYFLLEKSEKIF